MKCLLLLLAVAAAFASEDIIDGADASMTPEAAPEESLLTAVRDLRSVSDGTAFHVHGQRIQDHANLIQKAKAYRHGFGATRALKAALNSLLGELRTGHRHDKNALNQARNAGHRAINSAINKGKRTTAGYRAKACPTKKAKLEAQAKRDGAKRVLNSIKRKKVCNVGTTWFDMGIQNASPKFGAELRNKWDKERAHYLRKKAQYNAAVRAYNKAAKQHAASMASFKATVRVEASNANTACRNAHKEYNLLKRSVANNVATRKQVYIATLVIRCYVDNVKSNAAAKRCADSKRRASTSQWNITPAKMAPCQSRAGLEGTMGPMNWRPSKRNCHANHWNERSIKAKERSTKERNSKNEKRSKERSSKERKKKAGWSGCPAGAKPYVYGRWWVHYRRSNGFYRVLTNHVDPNSRTPLCENHYKHIPGGCHVAPDDINSRCVAASFPWKTHVLVMSNGAAYDGKGYRGGGKKWGGHSYLGRSGNRYKANGCSFRVLLKCSSTYRL